MDGRMPDSRPSALQGVGVAIPSSQATGRRERPGPVRRGPGEKMGRRVGASQPVQAMARPGVADARKEGCPRGMDASRVPEMVGP